MSSADWRRLRDLRPYWFVVAFAALSIMALVAFRMTTRARDEVRFGHATAAVRDDLATRLDAYVSILLAGRGLFAARRGQVDASEFRAFIEEQRIIERYPGIQGVGFSRRISSGELDVFVTRARSDVAFDFQVWPDAARAEYHSILFLEPLDARNRAALGYDMFTDPTRRDAMARARDTAEPAASARVTLVQEIDAAKQFGFLVYVPVYADGVTPQDVAGRREKLVGFVYSPFRVDDLIAGVFAADDSRQVAFDLYDGPEARPDARMHAGISARTPPRLSATTALEVAGRPWTLHVASTPEFERGSSLRLFPFLVAGIVLLNAGVVVAAALLSRARAEERDATRRLGILAEVSGRFAEARLDLPEVLRDACRIIAERVTDSCTINLVDASGTRLELAETAHIDPAAAAEVRAVFAEPIPVGETAVGRVAATGEPYLAPVVANDRMVTSMARSEDRAQFLRSRFASLVVVPLRVGEQVIGTLTCGRGSDRPSFTVKDQQFVQEIGERAAIAIENARLADRLRTSTAAAQEAVRVRDEFLSIAGHELRTPLTALRLQMEGVMRLTERSGATDSSNLVPRIRKANAQVQRLETLVVSLLDVSRITSGRAMQTIEDVDVAELVREVADRFAEEAARVGCAVRIEAARSVVARADRSHLEQVLTNLLSNAIKYGPREPIDIEVDRDDHAVRVSVQDRGIGISREDLDRVFGRFERAVSDRHYGGLGLGLWISRQLVDAMGGTIAAKSEIGRGSTFTVALPAAIPASPARAAATS